MAMGYLQTGTKSVLDLPVLERSQQAKLKVMVFQKSMLILLKWGTFLLLRYL